jgi:hypothetical protein
MAQKNIQNGSKVILMNTGQIGTMVEYDHTLTTSRVLIHTPSGSKIVTVLKSLIQIIEIIDGFIPLIRALWKMIFPGKRKALIDIDGLPETD